MVLSCPAASALSAVGAVSEPSIIDAQRRALQAPRSSPMELKTAGGGQQTKAGQQKETL